MNRIALLVVVLSFIPTIARAELPAELPKIPPLPDTATTPRPMASATSVTTQPLPTMSSVAVSPWPTNCAPTAAPVLMSPLPVTPTVPCPSPVVVSAGRPSFFKHMTGWFTRRSSCDTCEATFPTPQIHVPKLAASCATTASPCSVKTQIVKKSLPGPSLDRLKAYFRWKPCQEQLIPAFIPTPYESPVSAYFRDCKEPPAGIPCANHGPRCKTRSCPTSTCATGGCATVTQVPVGPIVSPFVYLGSNLGKKEAPTPTAVVPASATITVSPPVASNPLVRPFTSP